MTIDKTELSLTELYIVTIISLIIAGCFVIGAAAITNEELHGKSTNVCASE